MFLNVLFFFLKRLKLSVFTVLKLLKTALLISAATGTRGTVQQSK